MDPECRADLGDNVIKKVEQISDFQIYFLGPKGFAIGRNRQRQVQAAAVAGNAASALQ